MKEFMASDFLLQTETAQTLYFDFAKNMPVFDYHCHISPKEIFENVQYENMTQIWLKGDHYKWRQMRTAGIDEYFITGSASDYEKFCAYAETLEYAIGNPLYHWSHMELRTYFGINLTLSRKNAPLIWEEANKQLTSETMRCRDLIVRSNVKLIGTTDDPIDTLEYHKSLQQSDLPFAVVPTFRPDKAVEIAKPGFAAYISALSAASGMGIPTYEALLKALLMRMDFFHAHGCRMSDHGIEYVPFESTDAETVSQIFNKALSGQDITKLEEDKYKTFTLLFLAKEYAARGWVMQLHLSAMRNNNTRMFTQLGADTGYDSVHDHSLACPLSRFMDQLESKNMLPKTILYTLNPKDNAVLASLLGNFQSTPAGKIQFGSAWWFNDTKDGMEEQLKCVGNLSLLGKFVGMLTDSRSFLSYTRHDYFRRILCNLIGNMVDAGEFPPEMDLLEQIIRGICYENAREYFDIPLVKG